jgi:hypothetical protein
VDIAPELSPACGQRFAILQFTRQAADSRHQEDLGNLLVPKRITVLKVRVRATRISGRKLRSDVGRFRADPLR